MLVTLWASFAFEVPGPCAVEARRSPRGRQVAAADVSAMCTAGGVAKHRLRRRTFQSGGSAARAQAERGATHCEPEEQARRARGALPACTSPLKSWPLLASDSVRSLTRGWPRP